MRGRRGTLRRAVEEACAVAERRALHAADVDWPAERAALLRACDEGQPADAVRLALRDVVRRAGGAHSGLQDPDGRPVRPAGAVRPPDAPPTARAPAPGLPTGTLRDGVAVVTLPGCPGRPTVVRRYAVTGGRLVRALTARHPAGWVLDLRANGGGSMWPMLAVAAPLLGRGPLGAFVDPDGTRHPWTLTGRWVRLDGRRMARSRGPRPASRTAPPPVVLLTSERTASAAEAVVVAFRGVPWAHVTGSATAGFSTANESIALPDGSVLHLTTARLADRTGRVHEGRLPPDEETEPAAALDAALRRLRSLARQP